MTLKAVFLDVGNTLLYEEPSRFEIYAQSARRRGLDVSTPEMQSMMRRAHRELPQEIDGAFRYSEEWFAAYIERIFHSYLGVAHAELPPLREELFARFAQAETFSAFPGGRELLRSLRERGLRVGIISNWSTRLPGLLDRLGLTPLVDFVLCSAIERLEKPDARLFERALALAGVGGTQALHAGDDLEKDFHGARGAGLHSVLVDHFGTEPAHASVDGSRVASLIELRDWIFRRI